MTADLEQVDRQLAAGEPLRAVALLRTLFHARPTLPVARAVIERLDHARAGQVQAPQAQAPQAQGPHAQGPHAQPPCRVWFLRSFTVEPLFPLLRAGALLDGLDLDLRAGDFNAYAQEILDPGSRLYEFAPNVVVLAVQTRDLFPELWERSGAEAAPDPAGRTAQTLQNLRDWIATLRARSAANVVLFDFAQPAATADGVLDAQSATGQAAAIGALNQELRAFAAATPGVFLLGFDALGARIGRTVLFDERKWLTARMPFAAQQLWPVAAEVLRVLLPLTGCVRKAVVVDLDNTLWGGVVGEDGPDGIRLGGEYPGSAYVAMQRVLLDFHRRGIILAVASKNNPADALEVINQHPNMQLRQRHFAALELGWHAKSQSLRAIAQQLNIGTDSLVFVDDNPVERDEVRRELPEVLVIDLPADPLEYAAALRAVPTLERLRVGAEDRDRGRQYAEQRARFAAQTAAGTLEEFYRSLEMSVHIAPMSPATLARASQLTQKTNQFNLTTRRYDEAAIGALAAAGGARIYCCSVRDRFGDNGLVGVAIVRESKPFWEIDTLLLSCRVIGRTVETALLCHIAAEARDAGAETLRGWFVPTAKNQPAAGFYRAHGFALLEERDGAGLWEFPLGSGGIEWPSWLTRGVEVCAA